MLLIAGAAAAAEVVWLSVPSDIERAAVAAAAGATGPALSPLDLRAAATRWQAADTEALERLDGALRDARAFEARLDGELVILGDLADPIAAVGALRDDADRGRLYAALAYQGFAVDRYFADTLATDERAAVWRVDWSAHVAIRPWVDALALEPAREITAYEIAEAPQRTAYAAMQAIAAEWLPGTLVPEALPEGAVLVIDGRPTPLDAAGTAKVRPGRHLAHAEVVAEPGAPPIILARWDVEVAPAGRVPLVTALPDDAWNAWLGALADGGAVPAPIGDAVRALGGEVWLARGAGRDRAVWSVRPDRISAVTIERPRAAPQEAHRGPRLTAGVGGGWWFDDGFWLQSPFDTPNTAQTVNAAAIQASVHARLPVGPARLAIGADLAVPLGADHVARVGSTDFRPRPQPWVGAGFAPAIATLGWIFPWHPAVGVIGAVPLPGPVELQPRVAVGLPRTLAREGAPYATGNLVSAGILVAFAPGGR
jgi:hypothetical protein